MRKAKYPRQVGIRMPPEEIRRLREIAEREGRSVSQQIRQYVRQAMAREGETARAS